jgi:hypothetical protein
MPGGVLGPAATGDLWVVRSRGATGPLPQGLERPQEMWTHKSRWKGPW